MDSKRNGYSNEFFGEIVKFCVDREYIWFYDEISGGLYRLNKKNYIVETILAPMEIHIQKKFPIREIVKWKNEIYLIPNNTSREWLIYNTSDKCLRSVFLQSQPYEVGNVVNIGKWIYLIPEKTNHILAVVEAGTLNIKMITDNWYKNCSYELKCWGYSVFEDTILFPIIGTGEIFQIQNEQIIELQMHINWSIASISLSEDGIWILPSEGKTIFLMSRNGELKRTIEIQTGLHEDDANQFSRIIAIDKYVYLFPKQGGQILVMEKSNEEWIAIGNKNEFYYRPIYHKTRNLPYWGCYYSENKLYILPLQFRFAEISAENKSIYYKFLQCETHFMAQQYMSWVHWFSDIEGTNFYMEWRGHLLKDFWKMELGHNKQYNVKSNGYDIWLKLK